MTKQLKTNLHIGIGLLIVILLGFYIFHKLKMGYGSQNQKNGFLSEIQNHNLSYKDCNVIFISFDTLRADRIHALGYKKNLTPGIDSFINQGIVFPNAISVSSWTLPSTMSWFTGVYPSKHKVLNKLNLVESGREEISNLKKLSPEIKTLAEVLKLQGYKTGGFTGGAGVHHQFGFDQGFDVYVDDKDFAGFEYSIPKAIDWIKNNQNERLFVFLHGYNIHGQYVPEGGYDHRFVNFNYQGRLTGSKEEQEDLREQELKQGSIFLTKDDVSFLKAIYDEKVQRADEEFSKFIKEYQKLGLMDKTIFILTSDHGEELYEHGRIDHGHSLYDELIHVPLIISIPNINRSILVNEQVRSIDIMPTILDLLAIKIDEKLASQLQGVSLLPLIKGDRSLNLDAFSETDYRYAAFKRSLRSSGNWKLITDLETNFNELYNLETDKDEKNNLSDKQIAVFQRLYHLLEKYLDEIIIKDN